MGSIGLRGILPEIDTNLPCSFPPGVSQTWWNLTIGFYGIHLTFHTTKLNVDLLKNLIDMFMEYVCVHHVVKGRGFAVEMYNFLYHSYSDI